MNDENDILRENADLLRAFEERPLTGAVKVPERVLFDLEEAREQAVRCSRFSVILGTGDTLKREQRTADTLKREQHTADTLKREQRTFSILRLAAVVALFAGVTWLLLPSAPATARVVITSPGDEISETQPRIAWTSKDKPGQKYDVWILPAEGDHLTAPALFVAKGVTSPVSFDKLQPSPDSADTALQPGTDYRVLVCLADAGRMAGVPIPFRVKP
jgi:hypothetical protein